MNVPKILTRRELTPGQRFLRAGMQICVWLGLLLATRGLTSGAHWLFNPDEPYQVGAFAPFSPAVSLAAIVAGPAFWILAAYLADKSHETAA